MPLLILLLFGFCIQYHVDLSRMEKISLAIDGLNYSAGHTNHV